MLMDQRIALWRAVNAHAEARGGDMAATGTTIQCAVVDVETVVACVEENARDEAAQAIASLTGKLDEAQGEIRAFQELRRKYEGDEIVAELERDRRAALLAAEQAKREAAGMAEENSRLCDEIYETQQALREMLDRFAPSSDGLGDAEIAVVDRAKKILAGLSGQPHREPCPHERSAEPRAAAMPHETMREVLDLATSETRECKAYSCAIASLARRALNAVGDLRDGGEDAP